MKLKIRFEVYTSPKMSTCIVEPLDHTKVSIFQDNEAIYSISQKLLDIDLPSYGDLNVLISKVISSMSASLRFDGELNVDLENSRQI